MHDKSIADSTVVASTSMNELVAGELYPQLHYLFEKLKREKGDIVIDGVAALQSNDPFLSGKTALGLSYVLLDASTDEAVRAHTIQAFREIIELSMDQETHTWGICYYLLALVKLKDAGLLASAIDPGALAKLRCNLDWRSFIDEEKLLLKEGLPTNYYGVAFSVARLRVYLGWEDEFSGEQLLFKKTLAHYERYSGDFGFSDETDGEGRYDRYSVLLIAEICQRFIQTHHAVPERLRLMLRKSADVVLNIANIDGYGFTFGRSLGPYADSAAVEILSVAAYLGLLDEQESEYAYAYCCRCLSRYLAFWYDPIIRSVDMWGKGRRTDSYRAKHRILGENFSLIHQYISCNELWVKAGYGNTLPRTDLKQWLQRTRPAFSLTWFAKRKTQQVLAIFRDGNRVFSLPLVNGGTGQHDNSPYFALPFAEGLVSGIPDGGSAYSQLLPKFTLSDNTQLIPSSFISSIEHGSEPAFHWIEFSQESLNRLGEHAPIEDTRVRVQTRYEFSTGMIRRIDRFSAVTPIHVRSLSLDFFCFSENSKATTIGSEVSFSDGAVKQFKVLGLGNGTVRSIPADERIGSPGGPFKSQITYCLNDFALRNVHQVEWLLTHAPSTTTAA